MSKVFYPSAIEYQMLEDEIMGTNLDVNPYYPSYPPPQPYQPWWAPYIDWVGTKETEDDPPWYPAYPTYPYPAYPDTIIYDGTSESGTDIDLSQYYEGINFNNSEDDE